MKFIAGDLTFAANVTESSQTTSPQTGSPLAVLTIQFRAPKADVHAQALRAAEQRREGGLFSLTDTDTTDLEWRVREFNTSYIGTEPWGMHHHTWHIQQVERIAITSLVLGDITLEPYDYTELTSEDGVLRLAGRAVAAQPVAQAIGRLWATGAPIDVTRLGVNPQSRQMRVESYVWGPGSHGEGVALVCADVHEPRITLAGSRTEPAPAASMDALLALLADKGLVSVGEAADVRERAFAVDHTRRQVQNLDAAPL